jgi:hypothetical protein
LKLCSIARNAARAQLSLVQMDIGAEQPLFSTEFQISCRNIKHCYLRSHPALIGFAFAFIKGQGFLGLIFQSLKCHLIFDLWSVIWVPLLEKLGTGACFC